MTNRELIPIPPVDEPVTHRFPASCYANRELSWLQFNRRVLEEATDKNNPLCERMSFAAIFQSNLDEFFMVRVGGLWDRVDSPRRENKTGMTAREQLDAVLRQVRGDLENKDRIYQGLMGQLEAFGTRLVTYEQASEQQKQFLEQYYFSEVGPLLAPQVVSPKQPFPFLNGKDIYAVVTMQTRRGGKRLGIIPCTSRVLRRLVPLPGEGYVLMEDLILHFVPRVFARYHIVSRSLVRLLRNADLSVDDAMSEAGEPEDYRALMEEMLRTRSKLSPVRMDYQGDLEPQVVSELCRKLKLPEEQVFSSAAPLELSFLFQLQQELQDRQELFFPRRVPQPSPWVDLHRPMIDQIRQRDLLLSYPYESMEPFLRLLREAGRDPAVSSIQITLYRVAKNSQVVDALCQAAVNGKDVLVLVELRARFDEENNIGWSRVLEHAGCRVIYGIENIKIHSKLCLITRMDGPEPSYITQVGTGNYNEKTARQYTDLSLITADRGLGEEALRVFQHLAAGELVEQTELLMVAPHCLRNRLCDLMDGEIAKARNGQDAYIGVKCNSLTDRVLIDKLMEASQAGVRIEMVVRGICCMVSGVRGYTENIKIVSIVGRYLEHARIYLFGRGEEQKIYISSADFMSRNTTRRVEVAAPILDPEIRRRIREMFRVMMHDNVKGRVQQNDGTYLKRTPGLTAPLNAQEHFLEEAKRQTERVRAGVFRQNS